VRVLSRFGRYGVQLRPQINEAYAAGHSRTIQEPLYAMFREGLLTGEERRVAYERWTFNGFYQEQDEVTIVSPDYRIGVFDSIQAQIENSWSDEVRKEIENKLVELAAKFPNDMYVMPVTELQPPWPAYDAYQGEVADLMRKILEDGYAWEDVLVYEREHQNREQIVEALEELSIGFEPEAKPEVETVLG
jgi:hypothetical protein